MMCYGCWESSLAVLLVCMWFCCRLQKYVSMGPGVSGVPHCCSTYWGFLCFEAACSEQIAAPVSSYVHTSLTSVA